MLPVLCGGTGLYLESILLDYKIPKAKPNLLLRSKLENYSLSDLIKKLKKIDSSKYDKKYHISKRRLIRTIEILNDRTNQAINMNIQGKNKFDNILVIGLIVDRIDNLKLIKQRLLERLNNGMVQEVEALIKNGLPISRLHYFGLEYRFIGQYLEGLIEYNSMVSKLNIAINQFAKRQMTFFRRMEKRGVQIKWFKKDDPQLFFSMKQFLKK